MKSSQIRARSSIYIPTRVLTLAIHVHIYFVDTETDYARNSDILPIVNRTEVLLRIALLKNCCSFGF